MEYRKIEKKEDIEVVDIENMNEKFLDEASELISKYSWGYDYPKKPIEEIKTAEYVVSAFDKDKIIAFATVNKNSSPDGIDNGNLWLAHAVVVPEFRKRGLFTKLYDKQISYAKTQDGKIFACTDNPIVRDFFLKNGWVEYRKTKDEAGETATVFEYKR